MKSLEQVAEFNKATYPELIPTEQRILSSDRAKLRFSLILEELFEYAVASGQVQELMEETHKILTTTMNTYLSSPHIKQEAPNAVEQLDAQADLLYVVLGLPYETGFGPVFKEAFDRVHASNMSKICDDEEEAAVTVSQYKDLGVETRYVQTDAKTFIIRRLSDNKILKSHLYSPVYLKDLIHGENKVL